MRCGSFVPSLCRVASASAVVTAPESFMSLHHLTLEQSSSLSLWVGVASLVSPGFSWPVVREGVLYVPLFFGPVLLPVLY